MTPTTPANDPRAPGHTPMPRGLLALVGVIAVIEIAASLADRGIFSDPTLRTRMIIAGGFWKALLQGETPLYAVQPATMFVSHALLHGNFLHMAMNMAILLGLGRFTADRYGAGTVLPIFVSGAVAGGIAFWLLSASSYPMVGASGAVFGFLGVWIIWDWRRHRGAGVPVAPVARRVLVLAGLNVALYFALGGLLAWETHLGGFLAGLFWGNALENRRAAARLRASAAQRRRLGD